MPQFTIHTTSDSLQVSCFTTGTLQIKPTFCIKNENDALAHAMWLERHNREDEACFFLDEWLDLNGR